MHPVKINDDYNHWNIQKYFHKPNSCVHTFLFTAQILRILQPLLCLESLDCDVVESPMRIERGISTGEDINTGTYLVSNACSYHK